MEFEQMAEQIHSGENALLLWDGLRKLAVKEIRRFGGLADPEDMEQEAFIALYDAAEGFDSGRGVKFSTWYIYHLRNRLIRCVEGNAAAHVPAYMRQRARRMSRQQAAGHPSVTDPEDLEDLRALESAAAAAARAASLDTAADPDGLPLLESIPDPRDRIGEALEAMEEEETAAALWREVDALPAGMARTVRSIYQDGQTVPQIARASGREERDVRRESLQAIDRLRRYDVKSRLRPYLPDSFGSMAYGRGTEWESSTERAAFRGLERLRSFRAASETEGPAGADPDGQTRRE